MVEAPFPILNYLCKSFQLHNVPVGANDSTKYASQMPDEIRLFFTPSHRFSVIKSRYTGEKSSRSDEIHSHNLLNKNVDPAMLEERKRALQRLVKECDKIRNHRNEVEADITRLQGQSSELTKLRREVEEKFSRYQNCKLKTKRQEQKCTDLAKRQVDISAEKTKFKQFCAKTIADMLKLQGKKVDELDLYVDATVKHEAYKQKLTIFLNKNADLEGEIRSAEDAVDSAKQSYESVQRRYEEIKEKVKRKLTFAKGLTNNTTPQNENFLYKKEFRKLPTSLEDLVNHMEEIQARIECMSRDNGNILEEYEARCRQIETLREAIGDSTKSTDALEAELQKLHDRWYPEISRVVDTINGNFSRFMSSMGFAGEVEIVTKGEVSFRVEPLIYLTFRHF